MLFSEYLKERRKMLNLSQSDVARSIGALGIPKQTVSRWENNESIPNITIIPDLAIVLNVSPLTIASIIWSKDSRLRAYTVSVSSDFSKNRLEYFFGNARKTFNNHYVIRCNSNKMDEFLKEYGEKSKIKIISPNSKRLKIILNNESSVNNYTLEERFNELLRHAYETKSIIFNREFEVFELIDLYKLSTKIIVMFNKLNLYSEFKEAYEQSATKEDFDSSVNQIADKLKEVYLDILKPFPTIIKVINKIIYYEVCTIISRTFYLMFDAKLISANKTKFNYIDPILDYSIEHDWSSFDEYIKYVKMDKEQV